MKIPQIFLPESKNLEEKTLELAKDYYNKGVNPEEKIMQEEDYRKELSSKRKDWFDCLYCKPDTKEFSPLRFIIFGSITASIFIGSLLASDDLRQYFPPNEAVLISFGGCLGSLYLMHKGLAEIVIRYSLRKKYKK